MDKRISQKLTALFRELLNITRDLNYYVKIESRGNSLYNLSYLLIKQGKITLIVKKHGAKVTKKTDLDIDQFVKLISFLIYIPVTYFYNGRKWKEYYYEQGHPEYIGTTTKLKNATESFINNIKEEILRTI